MCGRYKLSAKHTDVQKHFQLIDDFEMAPREEIFPGTDILAVDHDRRPEIIHWTIEDCDNRGIMRKVINAKSETAHFVQMFKNALLNGRVLIPATGFYEWKETGPKQKEKYEFEFDEPLFAFAGIARECDLKDGPRNCGVILTTEANDVVRPIHAKNRMPVILHRYDYDKWLDPATPLDEIKRLLKPLENEEIRARVVNEEPKNESRAPSLFD